MRLDGCRRKPIAALWPAAGLRARAGDLELRWPDDGLLVELAGLAGRGVHADDAMPFNVPWTRGTAEEVGRRVLAYHWAARARVGGDDLALELAVLIGGRPAGIQGASGSKWSQLREVETGSWLGHGSQRNGIGTRMRVLMLFLCFDGLGAYAVTSSAFDDNAASNAVSRRVGYEPDGLQRVVREEVPAVQRRYRMSRERWDAVREANAALLGAPVELTGTAALRASLQT